MTAGSTGAAQPRRHAKSFVNNVWMEGAGPVLPVIDPSTERTVGQVSCCTESDIDDAVRAAVAAGPAWASLSGERRGVFLDRMTEEIREVAAELVDLQMLISGKPRSEAEADITGSIEYLAYYSRCAGELDKRQNAPVPSQREGYVSHTRFDPVGVVALILPWNFPLKICSWKLGPALAAGCTVVLKPSELTPLVESYWGVFAQAAGLPPGVINIVQGDGSTGAALVKHPDVRKVSFTGSTATGVRVMKAAADGVKNIGLELGGKSAILVFDDADLELAAELVVEGIFRNCGQCCNATGRLLVQSQVMAPLLARIENLTRGIVVGAPTDPLATMGPLTSEAQYRKVLDYFDIGEQEGLTCSVGGRRHPDHGRGFFVEPTIYIDVPSHSRLWNEELFGPVLCVRSFDDEADAITEANKTDYGLAATIVTESEDRAARVAAALEAGHVYTNVPVSLAPETSWGGYKKSGIGRELGPWGLSAYLEVKTVTSRPAIVPAGSIDA